MVIREMFYFFCNSHSIDAGYPTLKSGCDENGDSTLAAAEVEDTAVRGERQAIDRFQNILNRAAQSPEILEQIWHVRQQLLICFQRIRNELLGFIGHGVF